MSQIQLVQGDCLEVMKTIPDNYVDMVLCDLPYGTTQNKWDTVIPFGLLWDQYNRVLKLKGVVALFGSQPFYSLLIQSNLQGFKHEWVWIKNRGSNFLNTVREPMKEHELVAIFSLGKWTYNKQMQERIGGGKDLIGKKVPCRTTSTDYGKATGYDIEKLPKLRVPSSHQKFNTQVGLHPTQKPVELLEYLIRTYTNPGDLVMDNCMGSGSTGAACINTDRDFVGIEKEQNYFDIAKKRIEDAQKEKATKPTA